MNLVLIGYRGTGKSTIGLRLAESLEKPYVSFDAEIVRRSQLSIPEIVEQYSWDFFRDLESDVVADYAAGDDQILDTGGGVVCRPANISRLRRTGILFLLEARLEDIIARIGGGTGRPSLTGSKSFTEEVEEVLRERRPLYREAAHHVIDTSACTVEEAVREILRRFHSDYPES